MKRTIAKLIAATMVVASLAGCQSTTTTETTETAATTEVTETSAEKLSVITTIFAPYDFTREIVGDLADVEMLLQPGTESHSYDPTPQDIIAIQNCDLFIYTGSENDVWVDEIIASMGEDAPQTLVLLDCVDTVEEEIVEGMEHSHEDEEDHDHEAEAVTEEADHDHEEGEEHDHEEAEAVAEEADHVHEEGEDHDHEEAEAVTEEEHDHDHEEEEGEIDEHVWTSPVNAMQIVNVITGILAEKDEANAEAYAENAAAYIVKLEELDAQFREVVETGTRTTILFGDRFPFRYFADEYGLDYYAAFTGCSTETEASAATVAFLIEKTKELELPVVFTIELSTGIIAESICEATGAVNLTLHACHNITKDEMEAGETYLSIMTANVEALRTALN